MNHNVKTAIEPSEQMFIEGKEIKEEDIPDRIWETLNKAKSECNIVESHPAVKFELSEKTIEEIRRRR